MRYSKEKVYAQVVGIKTFSKTYTNNGISKTYVNTFVNVVYDKQADYLKGKEIACLLSKCDYDWKVGNYELTIITLYDADNKRSYYIDDCRLLISDDKK